MNVSHYQCVKEDADGKAQLCVVTKKRTREEIQRFYDCGERVFGENHAQELLAKVDLAPDIRWQFIGHLQRNKVRQIVPYVDCIQSLDSMALAETVDRECGRIGKVMKCLAEFHLAEEDLHKTGLPAAEALPFVSACRKLEHIDLCGIMVMGPHTEDEAEIARVFTQAHELYLQLQDAFGPEKIRILSMGMSADYRIALRCGSNMIRVGTYLFTD
jgi:pyridoxal phosphate enzyme (YggS family)